MPARPAFIYLLTATLFTAGAHAAPENSGESLSQRKHRQELLKRYDKNGDGQLDAGETAAMKADQVSLGDVWKPGNENPSRPAGGMPPADAAARQLEFIERFDQDGDGKLNPGEQAEADKARAEMAKNRPAGPNPETTRYREELLKRFDHNGDGKLDEAERVEAQKAGQEMERNGGVARFRAQVVKLFDKDGDGVLNPAEQAGAEKFRREQIKRFDQDGDGQLSAEERAAALRAFAAEHLDGPSPAK